MNGLMTLVRDLRHWNPVVRAQVASALGRMGDTRAVPPLIEALLDPDADVRARAATALGRLDDPDAAVPLAEALGDRSPEVCRRAADALGDLGAENVVSRLKERLPRLGDDLRAPLAVALSRMSGPGLEALADLLRHDDPHVRRLAAAALGDAGARALPVLTGVLETYWTRWKLGAYDAPEVPPDAWAILIRIAREDPVPEMRNLLPLLATMLRRRIRAGERLANLTLCWALTREIEAAMAHLMHLPIPSENPPPHSEALPLPAAAAPPDPEWLPLPAVGAGGEVRRRPALLRRLVRFLARLLDAIRKRRAGREP